MAQINKNRGSRGSHFLEREKKEFEERVLDIARVARVVAGGKRFRFRATVAIGDRAGRVGAAAAKGADVSQAVAKATHRAKKNLVRVPLKNGTIPFAVKSKYNSAVVYLKPAPKGHGIRAGGAVRVVCELAGIKDLVGKVLSRSGNKLNNARATIKAFQLMAARFFDESEEKKPLGQATAPVAINSE